MNTQDQTEFAASNKAAEYQVLLESVAQAFWETDANGLVVTDSPSWRAYTGQSLEQWMGEGWAAAVHPDDRHSVLTQWQQAVLQRQPLNAELRLQSPDGGWCWTNVRATTIRNSDGSILKWVGLNIDISQRKQAEQELQTTKEQLQATLDGSLYVIQAFKAVRDEAGKVIDFTWVMNNQKAVEQNGEVIGKSLLSMNPVVLKNGLFEKFVQVTETGVSVDHEQYYAQEQVGGWFHETLVKMDDGVVMSAENITARKQAEEQVLRLKDKLAQLAEDKYRTLFNSINEGVATLDILFDQHLKAVDCRFVQFNPAMTRQTGLSLDVIGKRVSEVVPNLEPEWFEYFERVIRTGEPERFELPIAGLNNWFNVGMSRLGGKESHLVSVTFNNITERKRTEEALHRQEQRTRLAIEAANLATWEWDLVTDQVYCNEQHFQLLGMAVQPAPVPSQIFISQLHPDDAQPILAQLKQTIQERTPYDAEFRIVHPDGAVRWMSGYGRVTAEKEGQPVQASGVIFDITERKQAQEALQQSEERFRTLLQNLTDYAILRLNAVGIITEWTIGAERVTGYTAEEALGQPLSLLYPPEAVATGEIEEELAEAAQTGRVEREGWRIRKNGQWFLINEIATALYDETGQLTGFTKISRDITERKRMEKALKEADRRKDEFLAMLAHELRNPMATLRSGLQVLTLTAGGEERTRATLERMNRQTDHLVRLVDDLLDVSRISRGRIHLRKQRVNLVELVTQAVGAVGPLYQKWGCNLQVAVPASPIYLEGDATRLTQVMTSLLTNGARYTGEKGQVWLSLEQQGQQAIFQVRDNGIGLTADQLMAIFGLFVQVDTSLARSKGGLGLGLTFAKYLAELHGGRVEAQSEGLGKGSTFRVYLPTLQAESKPDDKPA